ncbi:MAG TPA: hypothetical protein ENK26_14430 [Gammaproteobacteria bacterium]|nr:hypothetical protein [Gammaproteobacteria bacterium]
MRVKSEQPQSEHMARKPRLYLPDHPHLLAHRTEPGLYGFLSADDYKSWLHFLGEAAEKTGCRINGYSLVLNQINLLLVPANTQSITQCMRILNCRYTQWFNTRRKRKGPLWSSRYQCIAVEQGHAFLDVLSCIEDRPRELGLATTPEMYPWSSYRHHARRELSSLIEESPSYQRLGSTGGSRALAYQRWFRGYRDRLGPSTLTAHLRSGTPYGSLTFQSSVEAMTSGRLEDETLTLKPRKRFTSNPRS